MNSGNPPEGRKPGSGSRNARRRSRETALQGMYQWLLTSAPVTQIETELAEAAGFHKIDEKYFQIILRGAIAAQTELESVIAPLLDRPIKELSPIERGILLLGAFELKQQIDVPYRVVINEAVELAKSFGGADGHKYVNGVLDKLAARLRSVELNGGRRATPNENGVPMNADIQDKPD
ncbi:MAG TPA: transcription antitermination factor NusB [Burkholderiales bacterium]|nr:transcription antitermination factor NusB [Burkholderiales bacterium]